MTDKKARDSDVAATRRRANRLLLRISGHGGGWAAVLVFTALALAVAETAFPAVLGRAIDAALSHRASQSWLIWLGALVAAMVICDALDDLAAGGTVASSTAWLRRTLARHVLALPPRTVASLGPGEIAGRLVGNAAHAGRVTPDLVRTGMSAIPAVGGTVALGLIDPWLCVTFLAGLPVLVLLVRSFIREASDRAEQYLAAQGRIAARMIDAVSGARTIAAAGTVDREAQRVLEPLPELHRHGLGMWAAQRTISAKNALVVPLLEVAVLAVAGAELAHGRITPGQFLAAGQYAVLASGLGSVVSFMAQLVNVRAASARAVEILSEPPLLYGVAQLPPGGGKLEYWGVSVRAGDRTVLDGIDLVVPAGAMVAIVGPSGAGKSLLAALAGRLIDPHAGEVRLDGVPLGRLDRPELRRAVTYAFERPALIGETLADVIRFGVDRPVRQELVAAAVAARADDFIRRMPGGYRTRLAEARMSGGEVQRLSLARTFAHAGRVLIFDDVAASLDTVTEHHVAAALANAFADRTRIVIAHRASTSARADLVVWLDAGRVRAIGPHAELWADPDYRGLFQSPAEPATQSTPAITIAGGVA